MLVRLETSTPCRHAGNRCPMAPRRIPLVLAGDFEGQQAHRQKTNPVDGSWRKASPIVSELEICRLSLEEELAPEGLDRLRGDMRPGMPASWPQTLRFKTREDFMQTEWFGWYFTGWCD